VTNLRIAAAGDFDGFYRLRCQASNIAWTGHTSEPEYGSLSHWYEKQLRSVTRTIYVLTERFRVVGYLYADVHSSEEVEIGYGIDEELSGCGLGTKMIGLYTQIAASQGFRHVFALVAEINLASQKCLLRNGFTLRGFGDIRQLPVFGVSADFYKWQLDL